MKLKPLLIIVPLIIISVIVIKSTTLKINEIDTKTLSASYWSTYSLKDLKQYKQCDQVHIVDQFGNVQVHSSNTGLSSRIMRLTVEHSFSEWPEKHLDENNKHTESKHILYYALEFNFDEGKGKWERWPTCIRKTVHHTCSEPGMITSKEYHKYLLATVSKFTKSSIEVLLKNEK